MVCCIVEIMKLSSSSGSKYHFFGLTHVSDTEPIQNKIDYLFLILIGLVIRVYGTREYRRKLSPGFFLLQIDSLASTTRNFSYLSKKLSERLQKKNSQTNQNVFFKVLNSAIQIKICSFSSLVIKSKRGFLLW